MNLCLRSQIKEVNLTTPIVQTIGLQVSCRTPNQKRMALKRKEKVSSLTLFDRILNRCFKNLQLATQIRVRFMQGHCSSFLLVSNQQKRGI